MNSYRVSLLGIFIGLTIGSFCWEFFTKKNWGAAFDKTFWQGVALLTVWVCGYINNWTK